MFDAAIELRKKGFQPWPVEPGTSKPLRAGDDERTWLGREHQALTEAEIAKTWRRDHAPDIAIVLAAGQAVLDLDPKNDPAVTNMFGELMSETLCAKTPHDGLHAYYSQPDGAAVRIMHGKGFDLLGHGSLVVVPPSRGREFVGVEKIKSLPRVQQTLTDFLTNHGVSALSVRAEYISEDDRIIPDHARNNTLAAIAGILHKVGLAPNLLRAAVVGIGLSPTAIQTPLDEAELDTISESMSRRSRDPFTLDGLTITTITPNDAVKPLTWLLSDFLPNETITLLYGLPAQGKSWVATIVAACVASGAIWPGNGSRAKKGRVLYCDWERRGDMVRRRLHAYAAGIGIEIDYVAMKGSLRDGIDFIRRMVAVRGYSLVIIDSLTIAMMGADANMANEVVPALFELQDVCDEFGSAVLALDHQKKVYENENPWAAGAYGSIFKEAVATMVWQCGKIDYRTFTEGYMDFKLHLRKKNHERAISDICLRIAFEFDPEGEISGAVLTPLTEMSLASEILDWLGQRGEMDQTQLQAGVSGSVSRTGLQRELDKLCAQGLIVKTKTGGGRGNASSYVLAGDQE